MPISRYEIRNEYSLADPELYRAADKDDPEALLEGVAMAGLVGVLRQLGDLAEFAAEIFHDLHKEVMVTAARGHVLMIRVQQLESEVPPIERALLSQTDHSSFFYNAGVDWHPNPRMEQNLITQGDLPRFVMDSYEECRGPPRLFLLDKFDVAGAGSCLKRYTDPSFFKEGNSVTSAVDVQREKKSRRAKKRGQRWRNGETPELLPASHTKLHQLFLEERVENGASNPARRVKLKRRLNGFPFGSINGKSYMEKILKNPSPENKLHEVIPNSPFLMLPAVDHNESGFDVRDVCSEQDEDEIMLNSSKHEPDEVSGEDKIHEVPRCETGEKDIAVDGEFKIEGSLAGYQSDDIASEIDFVDAPSTMESEMDTDSEMRVKRDVTSSFIKTQLLISDADEDDLRTRSSDSQSTTESIISDERHNSSKKETSSFSTSDSPTTSAENTNSVMIMTEAFPSIAIHETPNDDDASIHQRTAEEDSFHQKPLTDVELVTSNIYFTGSIPPSEYLDSGVVQTDRIGEPHFDDVALASKNTEGKMNLIMDRLYTPSISESPRSSAGKTATDEANVPHTLAVSDCTYSFIGKSSDLLLHEVENVSSSSDLCNVISQKRIDTSEVILIANVGVGKLDEDVPKLTEISWSSRHDKARNENETVLTVSKEEKQNDVLDNLDSNAFADGSECSSCIMENYHDREPLETSLSSSHNADPGENFSKSSIGDQISSQNLIVLLMENCPELQGAVVDACDRPIFAEKETTANEIPALGTSEACEVVGLLGTDLGGDLESSCAVSEDLGELSGVVDTLEIDLIEVEVDEKSHSSDMLFLNETHVPLDESANDIVKLETEEMTSAEHTVSDVAYEKSFNLPDVLENSDMDEHQYVEKCPVGIQNVSGSLEELPQKFDSTSDVDIIICNSADNNYLKPQAEDNVQSLYHDLDVEHEMDSVDAINILLTLEENGFCTEQEVFPPSLSHNSSSGIDITSEGRVFQEKIELPPSKLNEEFVISGEISSGSSLVSPIKMLEHENSGSVFQHLISPSPTLFSKNPGQSGSDILPSSNLVSQENQINLDELPPLPPLPPVQWRIGKLQLASPLTNGTVRKSELSPQVTLPSIGPTNVFRALHEDFNHSTVQVPSENAEADVDERLYTLANTTNETISLQADINLAMVQFSPETTEAKVEESLLTLVDNAMNTTIDVHEDFRFDMVQVSPETSEKEVEECSSSLVDNSTNETIGPNEDPNHTMFQVTPVTSEEIVEESSSSDNSMNIDLQLEMGNELDQSTKSTNISSLEEMNLPLIQNNLETTSEIEKFELISFDGSCPKNDTVDVLTETESESEENVCSSREKINHSLIDTHHETSSEIEKFQQSSSSLNDKHMHEIVNLQPKIEIIEQRKLTMPFLVRDSTPPADEDSVTNGSQKVKLPRPRNPLVEDVTVLDKSKLRKVTERVIPQMKQVDERDSFLRLRKVVERVRPQIPQVDERDSLLQQIRTKSFNLKPAMTSRPSIRGPRTNLKVAAILEKANAIRQAVGGSDEDDDDNWSDS